MLASKMSLVLCMAFISTTALAGNNNIVILLQDSENGSGGGNTIFIDQTQADASIVAGPENNDQPAVQFGSNNAAFIVLAGEGGQARLGQSNPLASSLGNIATLSLTGDLSVAEIVQVGDGNTAEVEVVGRLSEGTINQTGTGNSANLLVEGISASGTLIQEGSGNSVSLSVLGNGTSATYRQIGNNLSASAVAPSVVSNGATVSITQTAFPGL